MKVVMWQPPFFGAAYLGARVRDADLFILSGTDQFTARCKDFHGVMQRTGQAHTTIADGDLTLPVSGSLLPIDKTGVAIDSKWIAKTMRRMDYLYKTEAWRSNRDEVEWLMNLTKDKGLGVFNSTLCIWALRTLGVQTNITFDYLTASRGESASDTILKLAINSGADEYITGETGKTYLNLEAFAEAGVKVSVQNWTPPSNVNGRASMLHLIASGISL